MGAHKRVCKSGWTGRHENEVYGQMQMETINVNHPLRELKEQAST